MSASTLTICRVVIWRRGLMQSAAATRGEIRRPVLWIYHMHRQRSWRLLVGC